MPQKVRFAALDLDHRHIYGQVGSLTDAGAQCVGFCTQSEALLEGFQRRFPDLPRLYDREAILADPDIDLIVSASRPDLRADLGIQAMQAGKDYMTDKPGFTTLEQLQRARQVQAETGRIYSVCFSERFEVPSAIRAGQLIDEGAIGRVVQTIGLGPHRLNRQTRPDWFWDVKYYGGIINDLGAHQADQFLFYTKSDAAEVTISQVANYANPGDPNFQDFGDFGLRSGNATGYVRLDWYTPDGLDTWGDGRMTILGTQGYMELRKYIDIAGRPGTDHLFLVNGQGTSYVDCSAVPLPYAADLIHDIEHRTETAMPQKHCFLASELALTAQAMATKLGPGGS